LGKFFKFKFGVPPPPPVFKMVSFHTQTCLSVTDVFIAHQSSAGKSRALHPDVCFQIIFSLTNIMAHLILSHDPQAQISHSWIWLMRIPQYLLIIQSQKNTVNNLLGDVSSLAPVVSSFSSISTLSAYFLSL